MKKGLCLIILIVIALSITLSGCGFKGSNNLGLIILTDDNKKEEYSHSFFSSYKVNNNVVDFYCCLAIENNSKSRKAFKITGSYKEDYDSGFIKSQVMTAYNKTTKSDLFIIEPESIMWYEDVCFSSQKGDGRDVKNNRLLPEMQIEEVDVKENAMYITGEKLTAD